MTSTDWDDGIQLEAGDVWEITCPKDSELVFPALLDLLPDGAVLHFQDVLGSEVSNFLKSVMIDSDVQISKGTFWPKRPDYHVRLTPEIVKTLAELATRHCEIELCVHLIAYVGNEVVMSWYDSWLDPICVSRVVPETSIQAFCVATGTSYCVSEI